MNKIISSVLSIAALVLFTNIASAANPAVQQPGPSYETTADINCRSDQGCSLHPNITVQAVTYAGLNGSANYIWATTCPSGAPPSNYCVQPSGTTGYYVLKGFQSTGYLFFTLSQYLAAGSTLLGADAACVAASRPCYLDINTPVFSANTSLSAQWTCAGGLFERSTFTLTGNISSAPTMPCFDKAGTGLVTLTNKPPVVYWDWFSPGDGSTDASNPINQAINTANAEGGAIAQGSAKVYGVASSVVPKAGVTLAGASLGYGYIPSNSVYQTTIKALSGVTGAVVDTVTAAFGTIHGITIEGINVNGNYPTVAGGLLGIRVNTGAYWYKIENVHVANTAAAGIWTSTTAQVGTFNNILVTSACAAGNASGICGAMTIQGYDNNGYNLEAGCGQSALSSGYTLGTVMTVGFYFGQGAASPTDHSFTNTLGESCDAGFYVSGGNSTFLAPRANFNMGDGFVDNSSSTTYIGARSWNNGRAGASTYDCFDKMAGSGAITNDDFLCYVPGGANAMRYAINDGVTYGVGTTSVYSSVKTAGSVGQTYNFTDTFIGPQTHIPGGGEIELTVNSATPSVDNYCDFYTSNTAATSITNFTKGVTGQCQGGIKVRVGDANTGFTQGSTLHLIGGATIVAPAQGSYVFKLNFGVWREMSVGAN